MAGVTPASSGIEKEKPSFKLEIVKYVYPLALVPIYVKQ